MNMFESPHHVPHPDMSVTIKRSKTDTAGSRRRTQILDFDDLTKSLVDETISIYQAQIVAVQPWPSTAENWESISQGWIEVCAARNVCIELDDEIFKVVRTSLSFSLSLIVAKSFLGFWPCHTSSRAHKNSLKTLCCLGFFPWYTNYQMHHSRQGWRAPWWLSLYL